MELSKAAYLLNLTRSAYYFWAGQCDMDRDYGFDPFPDHVARAAAARRQYALARLEYRRVFHAFTAEATRYRRTVRYV